jgi:hypothetical protein
MPEEPLTITATTIAEFLERYGQVESARMVRSMAKASEEAWRREQDAAERYRALYERLCKYEPPAPRVERNCTPPPEASD